MNGSNLAREARRRQGLSQAELARRLSTTQSAIARLESGKTTPSLQTVARAVRACGLDLHVALAERDFDHLRLIDDALAQTPAERLEDLIDRLEVEATLHHARKVP